MSARAKRARSAITSPIYKARIRGALNGPVGQGNGPAAAEYGFSGASRRGGDFQSGGIVCTSSQSENAGLESFTVGEGTMR